MGLKAGLLDGRDFVSKLAFAGAKPHGHSIRNRCPYPIKREPPDALYLVYISLRMAGVSETPVLDVRQLYIKNLNVSVEVAENNMLSAARAAVKSNTKATWQVGSGFSPIIFRKPCYFTCVVDIDEWELYYPGPEQSSTPGNLYHDPIVFIPEKVFAIETEGGDLVLERKEYRENSSFFDAQAVPLGGRVAVRCVNHFCKEGGGPLGHDDVEDIGFNILMQAPFVVGGALRKLTIIIDPDGQNQGPPDP